MNNSKSNIFIISGPSGVGKNTLIEGLRKYLSIERVITTSTRPMRPENSQGNPYYFISREEFISRREKGEFIEWAEQYNGNLYGVTREEVELIKESGKIGIWEVEWQGVIAIKKIYPKIPAIFLNAPMDVLEKRIRRRDDATEKYVKERMEYTKKWMKRTDIYDYVVVNEEGKLDEAVKEVVEIIKSNMK